MANCLHYREEVKDLSLGFRNREVIVFINFLPGAVSDVGDCYAIANKFVVVYIDPDIQSSKLFYRIKLPDRFVLFEEKSLYI